MITSINIDNANQYLELFEMVSKDLNDTLDDMSDIPTTDEDINKLQGYKKICARLNQGKITPYDEFWVDNLTTGKKEIKISTLEQYFSIISELVEERPSYGIMPLDESYFEINANTRSIKIPDEFTGVQVQGDSYAETIYFSIDRYFDATDLAGQSVYIQWERPVDGVKGYSMPWIVDRQIKPGYLVFGWEISSDITQHPGNVKFSVRFLTRDGDREIKYSLSTLPASLPIKNSLVLNLSDPNIVVETGAGRFTNGLLGGTTNISLPVIGENNLIDGRYYFIVDDDEDVHSKDQTLMVSAVSPDAGSVSYEWYRVENIKDETSEPVKKSDNTKKIETYYVEKVIAANSTVEYKIRGLSTNIEDFIDKNLCYSTKDGTALTDLITGLDDIENLIYSEDENIAPIYISFDALTVSEPGYYYCAIKNMLGFQNKIDYTNYAYFPKALTPNPLSSHLIREGLVTSGDSQTKLTANFILDTSVQEIKDYSEITYQWQESATENGDFSDITGATGQNYLPTAAKYYKCIATNTLNNVSSDEVAGNIWKVTEAIIPEMSIRAGSNTINVEANSVNVYVQDTNLTISVANISEHDKVTCDIYKVNRGDDTIVSTIKNVEMSRNNNSFTFRVPSSKCKFVCKSEVGETYKSTSSDFIFYIDSNS